MFKTHFRKCFKALQRVEAYHAGRYQKALDKVKDDASVEDEQARKSA